jgi:hypothetical protein
MSADDPFESAFSEDDDAIGVDAVVLVQLVEERMNFLGSPSGWISR